MQIILENIKKKYDRPVLKDISYTFESGRLYVIKGVSGCGKSTLFNIIGGLERKYKGNVKVQGEVNIENSEKIRDLVGYIYQNSLLLSNLTVAENLLFIRNDKKMLEELCEGFGILDLLDKYPEQISGGERQRVAIVRALLLKPHILLADEPTASLDDKNSKNTANIIAELKAHDKIILVATHEHYFDELADEIIYLNYGEIERVDNNEIQGS